MGLQQMIDPLDLVKRPSFGWEKGEGNAGILLLSCHSFRQTPKTAPTTGLSSLLSTSFTSLEKIPYFSLLGRND